MLKLPISQKITPDEFFSTGFFKSGVRHLSELFEGGICGVDFHFI